MSVKYSQLQVKQTLLWLFFLQFQSLESHQWKILFKHSNQVRNEKTDLWFILYFFLMICVDTLWQQDERSHTHPSFICGHVQLPRLVWAARACKRCRQLVWLIYICEGKQQTSAETAWSSDKWLWVTSHTLLWTVRRDMSSGETERGARRSDDAENFLKEHHWWLNLQQGKLLRVRKIHSFTHSSAKCL